MKILTIFAIISTVASIGESQEDIPDCTVNLYNNPPPMLPSFEHNPYLILEKEPSIITEGTDPINVEVPNSGDCMLIWELTGFYEALETGKHVFSIGATEGATIQLGFKSEGFNDLEKPNFDEVHSFSDTSVTFELKKGVHYPIRVTFVAEDCVSIYCSTPTGPTREINTEIKQISDEPKGTGSFSDETTEVKQDLSPQFRDGEFYYSVYSTSENSALDYTSTDFSDLKVIQEGFFDTNYDGINVPRIDTPHVIELKGHFKPEMDGIYTIVMAKDLIAGLQIGPGSMVRDSSYQIDQTWKIMDTRIYSSASFEFQSGLTYPFRIVVLGNGKEFSWDISVFDPTGTEVDLFKLWATDEPDTKDKDVPAGPGKNSTLIPPYQNSTTDNPQGGPSSGPTTKGVLETGSDLESMVSSHFIHTGDISMNDRSDSVSAMSLDEIQAKGLGSSEDTYFGFSETIQENYHWVGNIDFTSTSNHSSSDFANGITAENQNLGNVGENTLTNSTLETVGEKNGQNSTLNSLAESTEPKDILDRFGATDTKNDTSGIFEGIPATNQTLDSIGEDVPTNQTSEIFGNTTEITPNLDSVEETAANNQTMGIFEENDGMDQNSDTFKPDIGTNSTSYGVETSETNEILNRFGETEDTTNVSETDNDTSLTHQVLESYDNSTAGNWTFSTFGNSTNQTFGNFGESEVSHPQIISENSPLPDNKDSPGNEGIGYVSEGHTSQTQSFEGSGEDISVYTENGEEQQPKSDHFANNETTENETVSTRFGHHVQGLGENGSSDTFNDHTNDASKNDDSPMHGVKPGSNSESHADVETGGLTQNGDMKSPDDVTQYYGDSSEVGYGDDTFSSSETTMFEGESYMEMGYGNSGGNSGGNSDKHDHTDRAPGSERRPGSAENLAPADHHAPAERPENAQSPGDAENFRHVHNEENPNGEPFPNEENESTPNHVPNLISPGKESNSESGRKPNPNDFPQDENGEVHVPGNPDAYGVAGSNREQPEEDFGPSEEDSPNFEHHPNSDSHHSAPHTQSSYPSMGPDTDRQVYYGNQSPDDRSGHDGDFEPENENLPKFGNKPTGKYEEYSDSRTTYGNMDDNGDIMPLHDEIPAGENKPTGDSQDFTETLPKSGNGDSVDGNFRPIHDPMPQVENGPTDEGFTGTLPATGNGKENDNGSRPVYDTMSQVENRPSDSEEVSEPTATNENGNTAANESTPKHGVLPNVGNRPIGDHDELSTPPNNADKNILSNGFRPVYGVSEDENKPICDYEKISESGQDIGNQETVAGFCGTIHEKGEPNENTTPGNYGNVSDILTLSGNDETRENPEVTQTGLVSSDSQTENEFGNAGEPDKSGNNGYHIPGQENDAPENYSPNSLEGDGQLSGFNPSSETGENFQSGAVDETHNPDGGNLMGDHDENMRGDFGLGPGDFIGAQSSEHDTTSVNSGSSPLDSTNAGNVGHFDTQENPQGLSDQEVASAHGAYPAGTTFTTSRYASEPTSSDAKMSGSPAAPGSAGNAAGNAISAVFDGAGSKATVGISCLWSVLLISLI